jgi:hypothetical protein
MAYSKAKLKSDGDKASPCFRPFWVGNVSDRCSSLNEFHTRTKLRAKLQFLILQSWRLYTSDRKTTGSELNSGKHCPRFMWCHQFWFVGVVRKYANFPTSSKAPFAVFMFFGPTLRWPDIYSVLSLCLLPYWRTYYRLSRASLSLL